nr:ester cyclase [uncultured Arsenicibacter sp.]
MKRSKLGFCLLLLIGWFSLRQEAYCQHEGANKQLVSRYFDVIINQQKPELLGEVFSQDYVYKSLEDGSEIKGIKQLYDFLPYFFKAFPDIHYTIDQIIAEGDKVVVQATARGTQKGDFWGYPASNNKISVTEVFFYTVKGGKITENRRLLDLLHLGQQLKVKKPD